MKGFIVLMLVILGSLHAQEFGARYLIITHDNFYNAVLPLVEWKQKKGMKSTIVRLSEIGADSVAIRNYVINAYNNWDPRPEYLLLVGAPNYLPFPEVNYVYTDNYYTNLEGDIYNEILSGRLTVHSITEAQTVVNKILLYERSPYKPVDTLTTEWFKKACLILKCDFDPSDSIYWSDIHYAAGLMVSGDFVKIDTFSDTAGYNKDSVMNAVNNGRSIVMFRGSAANNWPPPFDVDANLLSNGAKLPIVLSITCVTIGTGPTPAVAERWFLTGTPTTPRGAAGYFATTTAINGGAYLRSAVAKGFHNALFNQNKYIFGQACEAGRVNVYETWPYHGGDDEYLGFTTLGDPEMNLWTDVPCSLICTHPETVSIGTAPVIVNVLNADDLSPINNATVCIMGKLDSSIYVVDSTDINGNAAFVIAPYFNGDTIYVTVTGQNLQPYEGSILVHASGAHVAYLKSIVDDALGGNGDGIVNPGEAINLPLWVKNYGDSTGMNISGLLATTDTYTAVIDSLKSFGNIPPYASAFTGTNGYDFVIADNCPDSHSVQFGYKCYDINDSAWNSHFEVQVHAAKLVFVNAMVSGGNGNNTFEPGESVAVSITLKNQGSAALDSISALLTSASPYIVIMDSTGFFDHAGIDSTVANNLDYFVIYSDSTIPNGSYAGFQLVLNSGYYTDTLSFVIVVGKKDYFIWNPDPTPASGENIHGILTSLSYVGDYGVTLPVDLGPYHSVFVCAGVFPNNYVILANCPDAVNLTSFANTGGNLYLESGDVWYFDPMGSGHDFCNLFGIAALDDGSADLGPVGGLAGTFTEGMLFTYAGENNFMDHISNSTSNSFRIFYDVDDQYGCGVAYNATGYRTAGLSFELGLLVDGAIPSTRAVLLDSIMKFFENAIGISEQTIAPCRNGSYVKIHPNPSPGSVNIQLAVMHPGQIVTVIIYDILGRCIKTLVDGKQLDSRLLDIVWNGTDARGLSAPNGVYFVSITIPDFKKVEKIILLR